MTEVLPDGGEAFRLFLLSRPEVTELVGSNVGVALTTSGLAVRYASAGGSLGYGEGSALLLVDYWGKANAPDDGGASKLGRRVCAAVQDMRGIWGDAWVAGAVAEGWPADAPDQVTKRPRQQSTIRLELYPKENVQ
jgi:hypothetical protein